MIFSFKEYYADIFILDKKNIFSQFFVEEWEVTIIVIYRIFGREIWGSQTNALYSTAFVNFWACLQSPRWKQTPSLFVLTISPTRGVERINISFKVKMLQWKCQK